LPPALTAEANGTRVWFDGQALTVQATNLVAKSALGAPSRTIWARDITALDLRAPTMLKNGTLAVVTVSGKTLVHYRRKQAAGVTAIYKALMGVAVTVDTGQVAWSQLQYSSVQRVSSFSMKEVAGKRWDRRVAESQSAGSSTALGRNSQTQTASRAAAHPAVDRAPAPSRTARRLTAKPTLIRATVGQSGKDGWVPPGVPIKVAGLTLPGGMLFVGQRLSAGNGGDIEPALINPKLPVDLKRPDWAGTSVGYWPSYSDMNARARAAYLTWLAGERRDPEAPISWPFLFFYGLERRVIVDATEPGAARDEVPLIRAEVTRLLGLYGDNHSFSSYATGFLDMMDLYCTSADTRTPPERRQDKWSVPMGLRVALGEFAMDGTPVPADWAFAWANFHPDIYLRTPAIRCPDEFEALFRARYAASHGAGVMVRATKPLLTHTYRSASAGLGSADLSTKLPDVFTQAAPGRKLAALVEDCTNALDPYSQPNSSQTPAANWAASQVSSTSSSPAKPRCSSEAVT